MPILEDPRFWWVSHNQTFKSELNGYIWSPKKNKAGHQNQFYDNMLLAQVGDIVFSFAESMIKAVGVVSAPAITADRPSDFGIVGEQWDEDGWLVAVDWQLLEHSFRPKQYINRIAPLLPDKYSPIRKTGDGNQGVYLAGIDTTLGHLLMDLCSETNPGASYSFENIAKAVEVDKDLIMIEEEEVSTTEKMQLTKARLGQGLFKNRLETIETRCRVTGVADKRVLNASHIKAWRLSSNSERLDGNNGLLLSVHIDRLFDRCWISFSEDGDLLVNDPSIDGILRSWGINPKLNVGKFNRKQNEYLHYHREFFNSSV